MFNITSNSLGKHLDVFSFEFTIIGVLFSLFCFFFFIMLLEMAFITAVPTSEQRNKVIKPKDFENVYD